MKFRFDYRGTWWQADLAAAHDLAIPQTFTSSQPNHFGVAQATRRPVREGGFIGALSEGGGCNVDAIELIPHCNGTHTESMYHIVESDGAVPSLQLPPLFLAWLISVEPIPATASSESYQPALDPADQVITRERLVARYQQVQTAVAELIAEREPANFGLILRTLPNAPHKIQARYGTEVMPSFLTTQAIAWIAERFDHLLVDLPSIDRTYDEGRLSNHHVFWRIAQGGQRPESTAAKEKTITEMIFVEDSIGDGLYLVNLQTPAWESDAAPSRPILFPIRPVQDP